MSRTARTVEEEDLVAAAVADVLPQEFGMTGLSAACVAVAVPSG